MPSLDFQGSDEAGVRQEGEYKADAQALTDFSAVSFQTSVGCPVPSYQDARARASWQAHSGCGWASAVAERGGKALCDSRSHNMNMGFPEN